MLTEYLILFTEKRPLDRESRGREEFPHCALMVAGPNAQGVANAVCVSLNFADEFKLKAEPRFRVARAADIPDPIWALFDVDIADFANCPADEGSQDPRCRGAAYHQKARQLEVSHRTNLRIGAPSEQTAEHAEHDVPPGGETAETQEGAEVSKQLDWSDDEDGFVSLKQAIAMLPSEKAPSLSPAGKRLKPDGSVRYMRKGRRTKVHVNDWMKYYNGMYHPPSDADLFKALDTYTDDIEKQRAVEREKKPPSE